jgi:hypothetical protein
MALLIFGEAVDDLHVVMVVKETTAEIHPWIRALNDNSDRSSISVEKEHQLLVLCIVLRRVRVACRCCIATYMSVIRCLGHHKWCQIGRTGAAMSSSVSPSMLPGDYVGT